MKLEHTNHDDAIDQTLAALKTAAPPDGMEARILQRLQHHVPAAEFRWSDLFARTALAAAWWRGALSGAVTATLLVGALLLAQHSLRTKHGQVAISQVVSTHNLAPAALPVAASSPNAPSHDTSGCPIHAQVYRAWVGSTAEGPNQQQVHRAWVGSSASEAPSHPAPVQPLTEQERALIQLAQNADPKLLAALSPETQARIEAQEADNYNKFFTPPTAPPQPADTASPTNSQQPAPQQGEQI
jgi:hypothetical protein